MRRYSLLFFASVGLWMNGCSSSASDNSDDGADVTGCTSGFVYVGTVCPSEGATCGECKGPPGPMYVCSKGKWTPEIAGYCDDMLPPE